MKPTRRTVLQTLLAAPPAMSKSFAEEIDDTDWVEVCRKADVIRDFLRRVSGPTTTAQMRELAAELRLSQAIKWQATSAVAVRNCEPPHQLNVQWLRLPDGDIESRTGAMRYMVEGC